MSSNKRKEQEDLHGSTLSVYWYLLRNREGCGVRELQRAIGFSSSSSAHYHLERLTSRGLLKKDNHGIYKVNENVKVGRISPFVLAFGQVFPIQLIYSIATTAMCILFLSFFWKFLTPTVILALSPGIAASIIFWLETIQIWRTLPQFKRGVRQR